jgi:hypothetical protein
MSSHANPKCLIGQEKECRQDHKVDRTDKNYQHTIHEFAVIEQNFDVE